jgi:hypothetical protein
MSDKNRRLSSLIAIGDSWHGARAPAALMEYNGLPGNC